MAQQKEKAFVERAERHPVSLRGFALSPTRDLDIQIADLSYTGCQLNCDQRFKTGEIVELRILKRGAIDAEIRWSADGRSGARFIG
jgi:hypothetical protein